jgi:hypothetical protein
MKNQDSPHINFSFTGLTSIFLGSHFLIAAFIIKSIIDGAKLRGEGLNYNYSSLTETYIIIIVIVAFLLFPLSILFTEKRKAKKQGYNCLNPMTKRVLLRYTLTLTTLFVILFFVGKQALYNYIVPCFLIIYSVILFVFERKEHRNVLIISGVCILFSIICIIIPSYWYYSLFILGVSHLTYGISKQK